MKNDIMAEIQQSDPARIRTRTVKPKRGRGGKRRPRNSNRTKTEFGVS